MKNAGLVFVYTARDFADVAGTHGVLEGHLVDPAIDGEIARKVATLFDLRPAAIIRKFGLKNPIYSPTAAYGHMGRKPYRKTVTVQGKEKIVQFFGWELLDSVPAVKKAFNL